MDQLVKATSEGIRIYAAVTTDLVKEGARRHKCGALATAALGRTMTAALLMAANLKEKECITLKFNGDGPLGNVTADASSDGYVRGYVKHPEIELPLNNGKLAVGQGIGQGLLSVTRFTGVKEPFTGSCEIYTGEVAEDITQYLFQSEQTPSSVALGVLIGKDGITQSAGGFIVQPLPDASEEVIEKLENNLKDLQPVSAMVNEGLDGKGIIKNVLKGFEDIHFLTTTDLSFKCQCSKIRTEDILVTLGHDDLQAMVNEGHAEVVCQFCGEKYQFNKEDLTVILHVSDELRRRKAKAEKEKK